ncbi:MAG: hypothetical protein U0793_27875 [Gemmataceae bacterium]
MVFLGGKDGLSRDRLERIAAQVTASITSTASSSAISTATASPDLAVFGYTNTGVGAGGPPAAYLWLQEGSR